MLLIRVGERAHANLRIGLLIFFTALLAVLPQSMLQGYEYSLPAALSRVVNPQAYSSFTLAVGLLGIALNPVMLFVIMYVIGRSLDLKSKYKVVVSRLFIGALVGELVGSGSIYFAYPFNANGLAIAAEIAVQSVSSAVSAIFVGFAAAALSFIRRPARLEFPDVPQE